MRKQKKEKLMRIMTYGYKSSIGYTDWGWKDGVYQPVGSYIQYPKNSNRQTFWKAYSNRKSDAIRATFVKEIRTGDISIMRGRLTNGE